MKKLTILLWGALSVACGHQKAPTAILEGEIKGLAADTIYLCGTDLLYERIDTLTVKNGKFRVELAPDTLVSTRLMLTNGYEYPIFLNKNSHIRVEGNSAQLQALKVTGNEPNEEMTQFNQLLAGPAQPTTEVMQQQAEDFIQSHPRSLVSLYLLEQYFVLQPKPDVPQIRRLINTMAGELKDRPYIIQLQQRLNELEKMETGKALPYFSLPNAKGKKISRNDFKDQYLLVHFWASYDDNCRPMLDSLRAIYSHEKKNKNFAMLGISLDVDTAAWHKSIRQDTLQWQQVCDGQGWTSEFIRNTALQELPTNLLLTPTGRIEAINITKQALEKRLKRIQEEEKQRQEKAKTIKKLKR